MPAVILKPFNELDNVEESLSPLQVRTESERERQEKIIIHSAAGFSWSLYVWDKEPSTKKVFMHNY